MIIYLSIGLILIILIRKSLWFSLLLIPLFIIIFIKKDKKILLLFFAGVSIGCTCFIQDINPKKADDSYIGIVSERKENYFLFFSNNQNYYIYLKNHTYEQFDILIIKGTEGEIYDTSIEGEFNFKDYLNNKRVNNRLYINEVEEKFLNPIRKNQIIKRYLANYNAEAQSLLSSMLFNQKLDTFNNVYSRLNINYLISISSIHIYAFFTVFDKILKNVLKKYNRYSGLIAIILLSPLIIFSSYRLSFVKTYLLLINSKIIENKFRKEEILTGLLIIVCLFNYKFIYTTSFIYIFVFSYLITFMNKGISSYEKIQKNVFRAIVFSLLFVSITLLNDGCYNLLSPIYTMLLGAVFSLYFMIGTLSFYLFRIPFFINFCSTILNSFIQILNKFDTVLYFNKNNYCLLLIIIVLLAFSCFFAEIRFFKASKSSLIIIYLCLAIFASPIDALTSNYVAFINVGQGDCTLIHNRNTNVLIDTGGSLYKDIANDVLIKYFRTHHIYYLDAIFITHEDYDHNGALQELTNNFKVKEIIIGSNFYTKSINNLKFDNLNIYYPGSEDNINSSVLYLEFINKKFLFMGDAPTNVEQKIILDNPSLDIDILKVGHHGSKTSTSLSFLKQITPIEAVISVGVKNTYGHPDDIVLSYLKMQNIIIRRTDFEGTIMYS